MSGRGVRYAFILFHVTLAVVIFVLSVLTVVHTENLHLKILAGVEALAAVLLLVPATLRVGAVILLIVFAVVIVMHGLRGELPILIYAAGVVLVAVHGSAFK